MDDWLIYKNLSENKPDDNIPDFPMDLFDWEEDKDELTNQKLEYSPPKIEMSK